MQGESAIASAAASVAATIAPRTTVADRKGSESPVEKVHSLAPAPNHVKIVPRESYEQAVEIVRTDGVCVVSGVWTKDEASALSIKLDKTKPVKTVNRRRKRFERVHRPDEPIFKELRDNEVVASLAKRLLGKDHYLEKAGVMISCAFYSILSLCLSLPVSSS